MLLARSDYLLIQIRQLSTADDGCRQLPDACARRTLTHHVESTRLAPFGRRSAPERRNVEEPKSTLATPH